MSAPEAPPNADDAEGSVVTDVAGVDATIPGASGAAAGTGSDEAGEAVPPPPMPLAGSGPSERRRARVQLPEAHVDEGPTFYRIGIDHLYDAGTEEITFQCARIKKLENLEAAGPQLRKLCLIANCVEKIENLESTVNLEHLELYQNLVKKIENIEHLTNLIVLDLSFNKIRSSASLGPCQFGHLERLYMSSNKITDIEGVFHFERLKMLELGSNRIRGIPPAIGQLSNLQELWLGRNKIVSMALPPMPSLRHLSLQNNRLEIWEPALFHNASGLTHLYLGHNNLPDMPEEFALLTELVELDLVKNAIGSIRPVPQLAKLEELWLNDNQISELSEVRHLSAFPALRTVYLERNPMQGQGNAESEARYKEVILQAVPSLQQLDALRLHSTVTVITDGSEKNVMGIRRA